MENRLSHWARYIPKFTKGKGRSLLCLRLYILWPKIIFLYHFSPDDCLRHWMTFSHNGYMIGTNSSTMYSDKRDNDGYNSSVANLNDLVAAVTNRRRYTRVCRQYFGEWSSVEHLLFGTSHSLERKRRNVVQESFNDSEKLFLSMLNACRNVLKEKVSTVLQTSTCHCWPWLRPLHEREEKAKVEVVKGTVKKKKDSFFYVV